MVTDYYYLTYYKTIIYDKKFSDYTFVGLWPYPLRTIRKRNILLEFLNQVYNQVYDFILFYKWRKLYRSIGIIFFEKLNDNLIILKKSEISAYNNYIKKNKLLDYTIKGLKIGDIIYDTYLRFRAQPTLFLKDNYLIQLIVKSKKIFSKMNIAIIPARSGSKRIPKKNIINFFGKPIIYYSIKNLKESNLFDKIFVSTDCIKTANICRKLEIDILKRPKYLCGDKATTDQIILFHFKSLIKIYKNLSYGCCMYATAPLINNEDLINAYKIIKSFKINSVFPVSKFDFPIHQALKIVKGNYAKPLFKKLINKNSQKLDKFYHDSGTFYLFNVKSFLKKKKLYYKNKVIILPNSRSQDINEISDLKIAKLKYLSMNKLIKQ